VFSDILQKMKAQIQANSNQRSGFTADSEMQTLIAMLKRFWSNTGDKLSQQYTGSNSNITRVIENGKQGMAGRLQ
jgi:hypothetical protein